ncbi:hypothetical protein PI125_g4024 [Phytophthora idaei]|nr:hypothetical protein PI125_g4024 [Phytophthora idaei]
MASQLRTLKHTITEKQRVFDAHRAGRHDWLAVAASNDIPATTDYNLARRGRADDLPRGGARHIKMTPEAKACLEQYLDEDCTYTLNQLRTMLLLDCNVKVHISTISRHLLNLLNLLYTLKQIRIEQQRWEQGEASRVCGEVEGAPKRR